MFRLESVTALIFCRSGCGSLVASSADLVVIPFDVFSALIGCTTSSGVPETFLVAQGHVEVWL